jgi:Tfp pilus assembly protein PilX
MTKNIDYLNRFSCGAAARAQHGVVLVIALIVLVAMTLAAVGMSRSIDTANIVAGNMGFKQATVQSSDLGVKAAYDWLVANSGGTTLQSTNPGAGYFSSRPASEPNWFDSASWGSGVQINGGAADAAGNVVTYMIHRMCTLPDTAYNGSVAGVPNSCAMAFPSGGASTGGSMQVGSVQFQGTPQVYYRITTRVDGPRDTVSVTQVSVLIQI